jgi:ketol-acid reductoisomerase
MEDKMAKVYYDADADLSLVKGRKVAVLGYGSQGHAHALNLRDSGVDVRVGLPASSRSRAKAQADGLTVLEPAAASAWADVIMVLVPDTVQAALYREAIKPNLAKGKTLMFAHGFNVRFGTLDLPKHLDDCAKVAGTQGSRAVSGRSGHARARGRAPGREREGARLRTVVRESHRRHACRRHRDDVRGRDRDRPVR